MRLIKFVFHAIWEGILIFFNICLNLLGYIIVFIKNILIFIFNLMGLKLVNRKREIRRIDKMTGFEFEEYMQGVLKKNKYKNVVLLPRTNDYGVDLIADYDGLRYAIQCKLYSNKVGNSAIQEVKTGLDYHQCDQGIVVTNNYFTKNAINLAEANGIILWNRDELIKRL